MKRLILAAIAGLVGIGLLTAQSPDDLNEGAKVQFDSANAIWRVKWWGKAGRTYFIQHSLDLDQPWHWLPVVEAGDGSVKQGGFTASGGRSFLRLRYSDIPTSDPEGDDFDGDGMGNLAEVQIGTSPLDPDSDGDGLPDSWEAARGLDPLAAGDAHLDPDEDGLDNLGEYHLGTDPHAADAPFLAGPPGADDLQAPTNVNVRTTAPGNHHITWTNEEARADILLLQRTDNGSTWITLAMLPAAQSEFTDLGAVPGRAYFYRLFAVEE